MMSSLSADLPHALQSHQLCLGDIVRPVSDIHLQEISSSLPLKWWDLPAALEMKTPKTVVNDIRRDCKTEEEMRTALLSKWQSEKGSNATYQWLINALLLINCKEDAEYVCKMMKKPDTIRTSPGDGNTHCLIEKKNIKRIEGCFAALLTRVCKKLNNIESIDMQEFRLFIGALFPPCNFISTAETILDLFTAITHNKLWDYWSYSPVEEICKEYGKGDAELRSYISQYKAELAGFKVTTKIIGYIEECNDEDDIADSEDSIGQYKARYDRKYCRKLAIKLQDQVTQRSLKYVDEFWMSIAELFLLPSLPVLLESIRKGCTEVTWFISTEAASKIECSVQLFYQLTNVIQVTLDNRILFPTEVDQDTSSCDQAEKNPDEQVNLPETPSEKPLLAAEVIKYLAGLSNPELIKLGVKLGLNRILLEAVNEESLLEVMVNAWLLVEDEEQAREKPSWHCLIAALEGIKMGSSASNVKEGISSDQTLKVTSVVTESFDSEDDRLLQIPQISSSTTKEVLVAIGDLILFQENIGNGAFASIHRAEYKGTVCAAKVLMSNAKEMMMAATQSTTAVGESVLKELSFLEELKHENIVQHLTKAIDPKSGLPILVMELMDCNLQQFITDHRPLGLKLQLTICHSVSCGLHYLHSNNIIHKDLCDDNILLKLSPELTVKISDFGMSRILDYDSMRATLTAIGLRKGYFPPEGQDNDSSSEDEGYEGKPQYSYHLDIYSFGAIATQTVQSADHFKKRSELRRSFKRIPKNHRLKEIIGKCIHKDSELRPSAKVLEDQMATLILHC